MLFGYRANAYTGANRVDTPGIFERNKGGTVFLDEIGDMAPLMQTKLLRFMQDGSIQPVGGVAKAMAEPPRIITATHQDLRAMTLEARPRFRQDLFYRLSVAPFHISALRERPEDILPLAQYFLSFYQKSVAASLRSILSRESLEALLAHRWPGNVRELESAIRRAIAQANGTGVIRKAQLGLPEVAVGVDNIGHAGALTFPPIELAEDREPALVSVVQQQTHHSVEDPIRKLDDALQQYKTKVILDSLRANRGNRSRAAKLLGMTPTHLHRLITKLHIRKMLEEIEADPSAANYFQGKNMKSLLQEFTRIAVETALIRSGNNVEQAANLLGITRVRLESLHRGASARIRRRRSA